MVKYYRLKHSVMMCLSFRSAEALFFNSVPKMILPVAFLVNIFCCSSSAPWPKAVADVARSEFQWPYILILIGSDENHKRMLKTDVEVDPVAEVISTLSKRWSILLCDGGYKPPPEDVGYFEIHKANQILAILSSELAASSDRLVNEVGFWRINPSWSARASIFVVVQGGESQHAKSVISALWRRARAARVLVMTTKREKFQFYSSDPYSPQCEAQSVPISTNHSLFAPELVWNLNQCKMIAASTESPPYVYSSDTNNPYTMGFEVALFRMLAEMMNFSYKFISAPSGESAWIPFLPNGTPAGLLGRLFRHEADFSFCGIRLTWGRYRIADAIDTYVGGSFVWAAPLPEAAPPWRSLYMVFDPLMWFASLLVLLTSSFLLKILTGMGMAKSALAAWASTLNTSIPYATTRPLIRLFLTFYFVYLVNVTAAYQSGLFGLLTSGLKTAPVETAMEASEQGYIANIFPSNILEMQDTRPVHYEYISSNGLVNWTEDMIGSLARIAEGRHQIMLLPDSVFEFETIQLFSTRSGSERLLRTLQERYGSYEPVFYMARDHPLQPTVQIAMRRLMECGWVTYLIRNELQVHRTLNNRTKADKEHGGASPLYLEQLFGAFALLLFLLLSTILVFAGELASARLLNSFGSNK